MGGRRLTGFLFLWFTGYYDQMEMRAKGECVCVTGAGMAGCPCIITKIWKCKCMSIAGFLITVVYAYIV